MSDIPAEWVEAAHAAVEEFHGPCVRPEGRPGNWCDAHHSMWLSDAVCNSMIDRQDLVEQSLAAVLPLVREQIAREPVPLPKVRHKGPNDTDVSMFAAAARRLDAGFEAGGSNMRDALVQLIRREIDRAMGGAQ